MYKLFSILLPIIISSAAFAQEKQGKYFTPDQLIIPGINEKITAFPATTDRPKETGIEKFKKLIKSNSGLVYNLSPDNIPCVVPNTAIVERMPNAFSSKESLPYMPNSLPLSKKNPSW